MADQAPSSSPKAQSTTSSDPPERRSFLIQASTAALAGVLGVVPLAVGLFAVFAGLGRKSEAARVRVAPIGAIPDDGTPRAFPVTAERTDAWTKHPASRIGMVFVRKTDDQIQVLSATCPHLGCIVAYKPERNRFACPCHASFFEVDGERIHPEHCPSPRRLDTLEHEVVDGDLYVKFQRFRSGIAERIPE